VLNENNKPYLQYPRRQYDSTIIADYFGNKISPDGVADGYKFNEAQIALNLYARQKRAKDTLFNFQVTNTGNFA